MSSHVSTDDAPRVFPHTRWSLIWAARQGSSPESAAALDAICRAYWYPLYAYVRRCGQSPHDAQDLTQEFFRLLLQKHWLDAANRDKGRLRTFLITAIKKFMCKEWRRASAQRRGYGAALQPFDTVLAEIRYAADAPATLTASDTYDRQWALTLLELTVDRLRAEFVAAGKAHDFDALKGCLMEARGEIKYADVAKRLGVNEGAARVAVHRLRKRFREIYREEISQTLGDAADLEAEVHYLAAVLARP